MRGLRRTLEGVVEGGWTDANGHMNVVHYMAAFERANEAVAADIGLSAEQNPNASALLVAHRVEIQHRRELFAGDHFTVHSGIAGIYDKGLSVQHRMVVEKEGTRAPVCATCGIFTVAIDPRSRLAAPLSPEVRSRAEEWRIAGVRDPLAPASSGERWGFVILMVEGKANHVGLAVPDRGFADLSLRGARIIQFDDRSFPKGVPVTFPVEVSDPQAALAFLEQPGLLMSPILQQEKKQRGWHLTEDAPDFVRTVRSSRSRDPRDMNCVEWVVRALELGGVDIPDDVLTPTDALSWCRSAFGKYEVLPDERIS